MIQYSHVALVIMLEDSSGAEVSRHLGIEPTSIRESKGHRTSYSWFLESKNTADYPVARIRALLDLIEPVADRLLTLDPKYKRWVDMLYRVTPQTADGVSGEFDWLSLPPETMARMARLQLGLSYEVFWMDHPDWGLPWHKKLWRAFRRNPNQSLEPTATAVTPPAAQEPRRP